MAKILCDCGCGRKVERPVFATGACRAKMFYEKKNPNARVRIHEPEETVSNASVEKSNGSVSQLKPKATGTGNMFGAWVNGVWTPK